jgi:glyoxylase I family protein
LINLRGIDHVVLRVRDIDAMRRFYCEVLGATHVAWRPEFSMSHLRVGNCMIDLVNREAPDGCNMVEKNGARIGDIRKRFGAEGNGLSIYPSDGAPLPKTEG